MRRNMSVFSLQSDKLNFPIVFFGSIPLRERVHGLHFRQFAPQFAYRSRHATSLKKTVLTNMGKLSNKLKVFWPRGAAFPEAASRSRPLLSERVRSLLSAAALSQKAALANGGKWNKSRKTERILAMAAA